MALIQERQKVDTELCKLSEALRDAEARAKTEEEERNQALQKLQTSTEVGLKIYKGDLKFTVDSSYMKSQSYTAVVGCTAIFFSFHIKIFRLCVSSFCIPRHRRRC